MTVFRAARLLPAALVVVAGLTAPAARVAGAEYTMATAATYAVDPAAAKIGITVEIDFANTFSAPTGQVSQFKEIRLAIHDHATAVVAHDATGALNAAVAVSSGVNVVTITLRTPVQYNQSAHLTLTYELHAGDDPVIRIGEHLVTFPAWGFGTASRVAITIPADFEVRAHGDPLEATPRATSRRSTAAPSPIPLRGSPISARRDSPRTTRRQQAAVGGTATQVRHWTDDPEWGQATMDPLVDARRCPKTRLTALPGTGPSSPNR
jgi:hypothetical protein